MPPGATRDGPARSHRADAEYVDVGHLGPVLLATVGQRVLARLADAVLVVMPTVLVVVLFVPGPSGLWIVTGLALVGTLYETLTVGAEGATMGMRILGVVLVDDRTGGPPGVVASFVRAVALYVPFLPLCWAVAAVTSLREERRRRGWPDRLAGTVLVVVPPSPVAEP